MRVLLTCDKSKGHFYPALTLARYMKSISGKETIFFHGIKSGDKKIVGREGFRCIGFDLKFRNIILESIIRFIESIVVLFYIHPNKVFGFGGRNSFFIVFLSRMLLIPVFLFDPNASLGYANRVLSIFTQKVFTGLKKKGNEKEVNVGIPLRSEVLNFPQKKEKVVKQLGLKFGLCTFFVFGGSSGSLFINKIFVKAAELLRNNKYNFQVIHIAGEGKTGEIGCKYEKLGVRAEVFSFYRNIGELYLASDFVISRGGASTIAEICFFGKPSLVIPYPYAYKHQRKNAEFLLESNGGLVIPQEALDEYKLYDMLSSFLDEPGRFSYLGTNARRNEVWKSPGSFAKKLLQLS